jgi:multidrug efflux pump subunit AcrB
MGIVAFALRYRHTFYVLALMMLFLGGSAILTAPKDIFPNINIPVVTVIWQYTGLTPEEMEQRVTTYSEYSISSNVSDIRNIESQTLSGVAVEKVFFQPNVNVDLAISQIVSASNAIRSLMPVGIQPPVIVQYNASSVPVLQLSLSSAIAHAPFEGVKMGRCLGLYFFGCGDIANMSQPSGDTAA